MRKIRIRIGCAQINCTVGDLEGNAERILAQTRRAEQLHIDIVAFPELAICGYPPEDLLLKEKFIKDNLIQLEKITRNIKDIVAVIGFVDRDKKGIYNAAAIANRGRLQAVHRKMLLPNYGVFDEKRYFIPGATPCVCTLKTPEGNVRFGVSICEDIWHEDGPAVTQKRLGATFIINLNASPYHMDKITQREHIVRKLTRRYHMPVIYTNLVGGQDELVFDGQSFMMDARGNIIGRAKAFEEDLLVADLEMPILQKESRIPAAVVSHYGHLPHIEPSICPHLDAVPEVYAALRLGLADYVNKNGFKHVVVGLSGGVDSALVAVIAADALGSNRVSCVFMPSRYSSIESYNDARTLAGNIGAEFLEIPIETTYSTYLSTLQSHFQGRPRDVTEENLQARIRGNILMALSNKFGWLVLTTGNKSEMSTGYATLYGDMAGGFAVIKDVLKTNVYKLARYRNSISPVIPESIITKAPTAELRENQKDTDTLPPYDLLDRILTMYVEQDMDIDTIVASGFRRALVEKIVSMVDKSEYKRRQAPPGIKITPKSFGKDRRMPITNRYTG